MYYSYISKIILKWRYGQVVRQWIANPLSPVRIWVPPNYFITIILFLTLYTFILLCKKYLLLLELGNVVKLVDTTDLKSVA